MLSMRFSFCNKVAEEWYVKNNPNLEGYSPKYWVDRGEYEKILNFVRY